MTTKYKTADGFNHKPLTTHFSEHLDLHAQGIAEISTHEDCYPLHRAVIENNLQLVQRIVVGQR